MARKQIERKRKPNDMTGSPLQNPTIWPARCYGARTQNPAPWPSILLFVPKSRYPWLWMY